MRTKAWLRSRFCLFAEQNRQKMFACFAFSFDHATPMKLCILDEAQIILVHLVLEAEEKHGEDGDVGHEDREEHSDCESCQSV